ALGGEQGCYYLTVAGSTLTYRGMGFAEAGRFTGRFYRTDLSGPNSYFGYEVNCESDASCAAYRGPFRATIGGAGPFMFTIRANNMPVSSLQKCS
ncbi:TPA: hypothetical protein ACYSDZ_007105, partial [Pseudomonas aeruginosa]|uniref:hypothetical protein n=1 Tax=Pseudomonas aeruginosa TaxID=287 RepID=UPI00222F90C4